jgi:2'-hydroxyisoflavone reductase
VRVLILGGTRFVGRHIAEAALAAGCELTLFNRGLTDPGAFPGARHLAGDRDGGLDALAEGSWDVVVDTCGYVPRIVRASAEVLSPRSGRYIYVSSASVYADKSRPGLTEDAPLATPADPAGEDVEADYDGLKAGCEAVVREVLGERAVIVRPGLIVGPRDPTNRFTYWVTRVARGGDVLAPEPRDQPVQVIDARDLASFAMRLAGGTGPATCNAVGDVTTMESMLATIAQATEASVRLRWVEEGRLLAAGVEPWQDLPLWLAPGSDPSYAAFLAISNERAKAAGLELRPLVQTIRDTLAWARTAPAPAGSAAGLDPGVEQRLLAAG